EYDLLEVGAVRVPEDQLLDPRLPHALDHGIVVPGVRQDQAVRHQLHQRRDAGLVRYIARGEDQRGVFAVQVGELALEHDQRMIGAGDVAGAARAGAHAGRGLDHGADHLRVLAHAEVIIRTPYDDVARALWRMPDRARETAGEPLEIGEHPEAALITQPGQRIGEEIVVVHQRPIPTQTLLGGTFELS